MNAPALLSALRPRQWTKNAVVLAAFFFALGDREQQIGVALLGRAALAALLFCALSSAVYLMNDARDAELDRAHPVKRRRPIASGVLPVWAALAWAAGLAAAALAGAWRLRPALLEVFSAYLALQILYTFSLKRVPLVDLFVIAIGFVLRALAGGVALGVRISPWLLLCTLLLALFLGLCKRRHELLRQADGPVTRPALAGYSERLLDQFIAIISAATIVSYSIYTFWPDTVAKFGTARLGLTIPLVIFGVFRYLDLVYRHELGDQPEQALLTDLPLLADIALYGVTVLAIFAWR